MVELEDANRDRVARSDGNCNFEFVSLGDGAVAARGGDEKRHLDWDSRPRWPIE